MRCLKSNEEIDESIYTLDGKDTTIESEVSVLF
jgi:hypothetical protein